MSAAIPVGRIRTLASMQVLASQLASLMAPSIRPLGVPGYGEVKNSTCPVQKNS